MARLALLAGAALAVLTAPILAQDPEGAALEVVLPATDELVVGHEAREGNAILVELVPEGETVETFTRMVTLQTAPGLGTVPEADFLAQFGKRYAGECPAASIIDVPFGEEGASGIRIDCPRHPATGEMETVFVRALDLGADLGVVQITMRYLPMPEDGLWARDYLGEVSVR